MYSPHTGEALHAIVHRLERQSVDTWRMAHAPKESLTDALAQRAHKLVTKVVRSKGGNISVTVSVECNRPYEGDAFYFRLQKGTKSGYHVIEDASTLTDD